MVFASTMAVYAPSPVPHTEESVACPHDVYGWTKLVSEDLIRGAAARAGWGAFLCRLANLIGPGETNPHLFPEIARQIAEGKKVIEVGNLTPKRNYIHVADVADLLAACLKVEGSEVRTINIGSDEELSVSEVLAKFRAQTNNSVDFVSTASRQRAVDRPRLQPDTHRMHDYLGHTTRSVDQAVGQVVDEFSHETRAFKSRVA
jgi:UDP-glucose 4-epimerase